MDLQNHVVSSLYPVYKEQNSCLFSDNIGSGISRDIVDTTIADSISQHFAKDVSQYLGMFAHI